MESPVVSVRFCNIVLHASLPLYFQHLLDVFLLYSELSNNRQPVVLRMFALCSSTTLRVGWLPSVWGYVSTPHGCIYVSPKGEHQSAGSTLDIRGCFTPVSSSDMMGGMTGELDSSPQPSRLLRQQSSLVH